MLYTVLLEGDGFSALVNAIICLATLYVYLSLGWHMETTSNNAIILASIFSLHSLHVAILLLPLADACLREYEPRTNLLQLVS